MPDANVRRWGTGSPERRVRSHIMEGASHASQRTAGVAPWPLVPQNETSMPRFRATAADRAALLKAAVARNLGIEVSFCGTKGHGATPAVRWDA